MDTDTDTDEEKAPGAVLGARCGLDQAVLGKSRASKTGDSMAVFGWLIGMMESLGAAGASAKSLKKSKKKDEESEKM